MAISNELLASTLYSIRDGAVDQLFQKVAFLDFAKKHGGIDHEDGGHKITIPLGLEEHSVINSHVTGYEPVSLAVADVMAPASFEWADFSAAIVISKKEELENSGEKAIVKILETRMKSVMGMLRRGINGQILANTGGVLSRLNTLNGGITTGSITGFLEDDAIAAQTNIVGGVSKATYNALPGWTNQVGNVAGDFSANGLRIMTEVYGRCSARSQTGEVGVIIASESAWANYKTALQVNERYVDEKTLDGGRLALMFAGAPVVQDIEMPATAGASSKPYSMYFLNFDSVKLIMHSDADFALDDFIDIPGTATRGSKLYWKGQLITGHLGSLGLVYDGDTN